MLWSVLGDSAKVRFDDMVTIKEWHLTVRLDPNLSIPSSVLLPHASEWVDGEGRRTLFLA